MNKFTSIASMWQDAILDVLNNGDELPSRDGPTKEVLGWTGRLLDPTANFLFNPIRKLSPSYAAAELLWILSGQRTISNLLPYAPQYSRFCNKAQLWVGESGMEVSADTPGAQLKEVEYAHGAYGWRMTRRFGGYNVLAHIIRMLKTDPGTRQAVVVPYDTALDLEKSAVGDKKDIPCTISLNFMLRQNKLYLSVNMRSNDLWLGMPHDVFVFTSLQQLVANALGAELGWYQHSAMSMHLYHRNLEKARAAYLDGSMSPSLIYKPHGVVSWSTAEAVALEYTQRVTKHVAATVDELGVGTLPHQLVLMTGLKWVTDKTTVLDRITNNSMAGYMERYFANH